LFEKTFQKYSITENKTNRNLSKENNTKLNFKIKIIRLSNLS